MDKIPPENRSKDRSTPWLAVVGILVLFLLLGELWRRIGQASELRRLENRLQVQVTALASQSAALGTAIAQARSDESVARWAREEGKMALPGEVLVQPVAPPGTPAPEPGSNLSPPAPPNWRIWWEWLWGED